MCDFLIREPISIADSENSLRCVIASIGSVRRLIRGWIDETVESTADKVGEEIFLKKEYMAIVFCYHTSYANSFSLNRFIIFNLA